MKFKLSGNNINVSITNTKGESVYIYQVDALNVELDVAKLIESANEIQQAVSDIVEMAFNEPTPTTSLEA